MLLVRFLIYIDLTKSVLEDLNDGRIDKQALNYPSPLFPVDIA